MIRQVFAFHYLKEMVTKFNKFSVIIIDEASDWSSLKQIAILVTYFDMVECSNGTTEGIY